MGWLTTKLLAYVSCSIILILLAFVGVQTLRLGAAENKALTIEASYAAAYAKSLRQGIAAERARNVVSETVADTTREQARAASADVQTTTAAAIERVRTVRVEVPANCPTELPREIVDEGMAAVNRANEAKK